MKRVIFASDFHLKFQQNQEDRARQTRVLNFLDSLIGNTEMLILNGDIFDLWFAWNQVIIKGYFPLLCKLKSLRESGCRIILVAGNHDFWFNGFLDKELGLEIYPDNFSIELQGKRILCNHGDLYTANDLRYKIFRGFIRNKFVMSLFRILHPDFSLRLGMLLSRSSRDRKIPEKLRRAKEAGLENFAQKQFENYDLVVLGHSHNPKIIDYADGTYANSGDWISHNSYLELIEGKLMLNYFAE
ncbi:MAG: UDP-2,3-diacylglucosamine diphosphatase [Candidatus Cloacimonadales bacterium]